MKLNEWNKDDYEVVGLEARKWTILHKVTKERLMLDCVWEWRQSAQDVLDSFDQMIKENVNAPY